MRPFKAAFGYCFIKKQLIALSSLLTELNDEAEVIDTILHEIAHALAPKRAWHNQEWKTIATTIGCTGLRCYQNDVLTPPKQWLGTCPVCTRTVLRHRRKNIACAHCCRGTYQTQYKFTWRKA